MRIKRREWNPKSREEEVKKMRKFRSFFTTCFILVSLFSLANLGWAIDFPTKPVNLIVTYPPGGSTDVTVRIMSEKFSANLGVPVVVLNKPGSGGLVGGEFAARTNPDGYNIVVLSLAHIIRQVIDPKMPFDVLKDFDPICRYVSQPLVLVVKGDSKFKTIDDLIDFAKKNPGKLSMGHSGIGGANHFAGELFKAATKLSYKWVPFAGDAGSVTALMGGHIDFMAVVLPPVAGKLASGDLRPLATFEEKRLPEFKDVPTLKEKGYPDVVTYSWFAFAAPAGTPKEIVEKLDRAFRSAIKDPATVEALTKIGCKECYIGPAEFSRFIRSELGRFGEIAKKEGITLKQ